RTGEPNVNEETNTYASGVTRTVLVKKSLYRDKAGKIFLVGVTRDITDRKRAEEDLRSTKDFLEKLIDHANAPIVVWDPSFRIIRFNHAFERLTGRSAEDVIGMPLEILFPEENKDRAMMHIRRALLGEQWNVVEIPVVGEDGSIRTVLWNSANLYESDGSTLIATVAQGQDITGRKRAEEVLKESEQRLADIIDFLPDATFVIDRTGRVVAWNRAIEAMTGVKAGEILGRGDYEYSLPFYGERRPVLIDLVLTPDDVIESSYTHIERRDGILEGEAYMPNMKGGSVYLYGRAAVLYDSAGDVFGAIESIRDITARKVAEEELYRAKEAAERAASAKAAFLANMSHEIRTPLNAVVGLTGLLLSADLTAEQRDCIETIRSSGNTLLAMINDILDFSKIESGRMELESQPFAVRGFIESTLALVAEDAARKGLELSYLVEDGVPYAIRGDETRLRQVLLNLLVNAVKFTQEGRISVHVSSRRAEDGAHDIHFEVKDTGIGIPVDRMDRLFLSFSQLDASTTRKYGGTGLGLAISRRLVELMGGSIWAESEVGQGSTFHFTLKARPAEHEVTRSEPFRLPG
ncbi:MAG: PAS domain S-box protein, partial [Methanothrix sp.]|nr:PAS domain S-box protein [Methanothrix sp.]